MRLATQNRLFAEETDRQEVFLGFFADIEMEKALEFHQRVHLHRFFLEPADQQHPAIE